jgi:hypothetical protein
VDTSDIKGDRAEGQVVADLSFGSGILGISPSKTDFAEAICGGGRFSRER